MIEKTFEDFLGEKLAYVDTKKEGKKTLLLIHGNMSSSIFFQSTIEAFKSEYRILAPDLPGFGDSSHNSDYPDLKSYADLMARFLIKKVPGQVFLLGWSMGAGVVYQMLLDPLIKDRIDKAIILSGVGLGGYGYKQVLEKRIMDFKPFENFGSKTFLEKVEDIKEFYRQAQNFGLQEEIRFTAIRNILKKSVYSDMEVDEAELDRNTKEALKQNNHREIIKSLYNFDLITNEEYKKIDKKLLILHGSKDKVVLEETAHEAYELLKERAKLVILEGSHGLMATNFYEYIREISKFIGGGQ